MITLNVQSNDINTRTYFLLMILQKKKLLILISSFIKFYNPARKYVHKKKQPKSKTIDNEKSEQNHNTTNFVYNNDTIVNLLDKGYQLRIVRICYSSLQI